MASIDTDAGKVLCKYALLMFTSCDSMACSNIDMFTGLILSNSSRQTRPPDFRGNTPICTYCWPSAEYSLLQVSPAGVTLAPLTMADGVITNFEKDLAIFGELPICTYISVGVRFGGDRSYEAAMLISTPWVHRTVLTDHAMNALDA